MSSIIRQGTGKDFWCKIGLHKYGRWRGIDYFSSNVIDLEKKCSKCGQVKRKTVAK